MRDWFSERVRDVSIKQWLAIGVILLAVALLGERLITQGTFLGYQVYEKNTASRKSEEALKKAQADKVKGSKVCQAFDEKRLKQITGQEFTKGALFADTREPTINSSCILNAKNSSDGKAIRAIVASLQERRDEASAQEEFSKQLKRANVEQVTGVGESALFETKTGRLLVKKGKTTFSVTVNSKEKEKSANKDVTIELAKELANAIE